MEKTMETTDGDCSPVLRCLCCDEEMLSSPDYEDHLMSYHQMNALFAIKFAQKSKSIEQLVEEPDEDGFFHSDDNFCFDNIKVEQIDQDDRIDDSIAGLKSLADILDEKKSQGEGLSTIGKDIPKAGRQQEDDTKVDLECQANGPPLSVKEYVKNENIRNPKFSPHIIGFTVNNTDQRQRNVYQIAPQVQTKAAVPKKKMADKWGAMKSSTIKISKPNEKDGIAPMKTATSQETPESKPVNEETSQREMPKYFENEGIKYSIQNAGIRLYFSCTFCSLVFHRWTECKQHNVNIHHVKVKQDSYLSYIHESMERL